MLLMPESPFGRKPLKPFPSLPVRLALLLPGGETNRSLSRSVGGAGVFPDCFLDLATMFSLAVRRFGRRRPGSKAEKGELTSPSVARIKRSDLPLYYLSGASTAPSPRHSFKPDETSPPRGALALLQAACVGDHGNAGS